jgi:hypothetical protein
MYLLRMSPRVNGTPGGRHHGRMADHDDEAPRDKAQKEPDESIQAAVARERRVRLDSDVDHLQAGAVARDLESRTFILLRDFGVQGAGNFVLALEPAQFDLLRIQARECIEVFAAEMQYRHQLRSPTLEPRNLGATERDLVIEYLVHGIDEWIAEVQLRRIERVRLWTPGRLLGGATRGILRRRPSRFWIAVGRCRL